MVNMEREISDEHKKFNHHHKITDEQEIVDFGTGKFIADKKRIALLKALNDCGLVTRTHCYGHETGHSFVSILLDEDISIEVKTICDRYTDKRIKKGTHELLITWWRKD